MLKGGNSMYVPSSDWICALRSKHADKRQHWLTTRQVNIFNDSTKEPSTTKSTIDKENSAPPPSDNQQEPQPSPPAEKTEAEIQSEIQSLFRQITASVTFLPMLDGNCTFNVLVYADADSEVPLEWGDSDAKEVKNAEKVMLRSFSTNNHRIDTVVSYRLAE